MAKLMIEIPDELLRKARMHCRRMNTPLAVMMRRLVEGHVDRMEGLGGNYEILVDFSLGRITQWQAMKKLSIGSQFGFRELMAASRLPMPRQRRDQIRAMVRETLPLLEQCIRTHAAVMDDDHE